MSLIKQELWRRQNAVSEAEERFLEGGPVPDFDAMREFEAQQLYYDLQYIQDSMPSYA